MRDNINFKKNSNLFIKNGWTKIKLKSDSNSALFNAQNSLLKFLQTIIPNLNKLEDYHKFIDSDERHLDIQIKITEYFRKNKFMHKIVNENLNNISPYIGLDLMIQKNPYLRIARPFKSIDNIGYHRDTAYGSSPFEASLSIPFSNVKKLGSLSFISSSHNWPDSQLKALHTKSDRILKNSTLHKLGFPYSPQKISDDILKNAKPIHIKFGEAIMFSLSLIHGQEKNMSFSTRFQSDIRLVNSLAVFEKNRSSESEYYEELINTAITINAKKFIKINNI